MKRLAIIAALAVALSGCGMTMQELADARDECNALGGTFRQYQSGLDGGERYRCNFSQDEARDD